MLDYYRFKSVHDLFVKGRMDEAYQELAELQRRYVTLCDENTTFKMQLQEFEDILYLARNLAYDGEFYWLETGSIRQGPFCPNCYTRDGLLMRLSGERHDRYCTTCRELFKHPDMLAAAMPQDHVPMGDTGYPPPMREVQRKAKVIPFAR